MNRAATWLSKEGFVELLRPLGICPGMVELGNVVDLFLKLGGFFTLISRVAVLIYNLITTE